MAPAKHLTEGALLAGGVHLIYKRGHITYPFVYVLQVPGTEAIMTLHLIITKGRTVSPFAYKQQPNGDKLSELVDSYQARGRYILT
jgi:hypothetical protein